MGILNKNKQILKLIHLKIYFVLPAFLNDEIGGVFVK